MSNKTKQLRPNNFVDFVGQKNVIETLKIVIDSSNKQNKILDHILFYGPPGRGKTTLASIISNHTQRKISFVQGALLNQKSDLLEVFALVKENDILFIDEIHSMNKNIEELIYSAMEDYVLDIPIGPEGEKRIIRMKLKPFTLIGATTKIDKISKPIKDRFGLIFKLDNYSINDIKNIIIKSCIKLNNSISDEDALLISQHSQYNPRFANNLIKRVIDFAQFYNNGTINKEIINKTFKSLSIHNNGLTNLHVEYLNILSNIFNKKYVSINVICSIMNESKNTIINDIEPILLAQNLITKSSKGRCITEEGEIYIKKIKTHYKYNIKIW